MYARSVAVLLLIVVLMLHLAEEVQTGFRQRLPTGEMPLPVFLGINLALYGFCFATLALSLRSSEWAVPTAWALFISMALNGLGHIGIMLIKEEYFPGGLTAFFLLLASGYLILQLWPWG
jgi:hypothetical protein